MSKKMKIIIPCVVGIVIIAICIIIGIMKYNKFELISKAYTYELGSELDTVTTDYVKCGNSKIEKNAELNFSDVDINKVGEYTATATYGKKILKFAINIEDTTKPEIKTKAVESFPVVGKEYAVSNFIDSATDLGEIKNISIKKNEKELANGTDISEMNIIFDDSGECSLTIQAEDMSGNIGEESFDIKVIKDYEPMVTGFKDWSFQEGSELPDFMEGIEKTDEIASVTPKTDTIDANTVGTYTLTYEVLGDDNETTFTHDVSVTVTAKPVEKPKKQTTSSGSQGSSNSSSGSKSSNSSGNSSQGSSGSSSGGGSSDSDESLDFLNSEWQGKTVGEYTAAHGYGLCGGTPSGGIFFYPDDYVIGSHATLTFSDGTTMTGI